MRTIIFKQRAKKRLDIGRYLTACANSGKGLLEVKDLFETVKDPENLSRFEVSRLAIFLSLPNDKFKKYYLYPTT